MAAKGGGTAAAAVVEANDGSGSSVSSNNSGGGSAMFLVVWLLGDGWGAAEIMAAERGLLRFGRAGRRARAASMADGSGEGKREAGRCVG